MLYTTSRHKTRERVPAVYSYSEQKVTNYSDNARMLSCKRKSCKDLSEASALALIGQVMLYDTIQTLSHKLVSRTCIYMLCICARRISENNGPADQFSSLVPRPPPQLSSLAVRITLSSSVSSLAVRITLSVIRTASDDSCGGGLGTRLPIFQDQTLRASTPDTAHVFL